MLAILSASSLNFTKICAYTIRVIFEGSTRASCQEAGLCVLGHREGNYSPHRSFLLGTNERALFCGVTSSHILALLS